MKRLRAWIETEMAISPINLTRISQGMRTDFVVQSLRQNQRELFLAQTRIATGRSFVSPSENPVAASRAADLSLAVAQQTQFRDNLRHGDNSLAAADSAISEISGLLIEAASIASQNVSNLTSAAERQAVAELIGGIRDQLQIVGNRQFNGLYIFGGRDTTSQPFIDAFGGIAYVGDTGERFTRADSALSVAINVPGNELFSALSAQIATDVDLTPTLTESIRLEDITGATEEPIRTGTLLINEIGGAGLISVDLTTADTIGDVVDLINAAATEAGSSLTASLSDTGLVLTPGSWPITVGDSSSGAIASDLGVRTPDPTSDAINGIALTPNVTRLTPVEDLNAGVGIDLEGGLIISNGPRTATLDFSDAETVQDIINTINNAGVGVLARINDAKNGIDVFNQMSGTSLSIGENGGTTAADLGIRTFDSATPLSSLNFGHGVTTMEGKDDLRITAKDGSTVDVDLDSAESVGDVITLINDAATAAGVSITAAFAETGNGIQITDDTGGTGDLAVTGLNLSAAAMDLGINQRVTGDETVLTGEDVNPTRTEGILSALIDLENALRRDDTQGISLAGERIDELSHEVTRTHGIIGARAQAMTAKRIQASDAAVTAEIMLSEVQDVDYAEAITRLQASVTQLQASLQTGSTLLSLSLLDFLR